LQLNHLSYRTWIDFFLILGLIQTCFRGGENCSELVDYISIGGTEYVPASNGNQSKELKELKDALKELLTFRSVSDVFEITDFAKEVMKKLG